MNRILEFLISKNKKEREYIKQIIAVLNRGKEVISKDLLFFIN